MARFLALFCIFLALGAAAQDTRLSTWMQDSLHTLGDPGAPAGHTPVDPNTPQGANTPNEPGTAAPNNAPARPKTLQDIVLPGSHDAGMSVLTATGGTQAGTINECNTLTQVLPVSAQLRQGIRMFDLRVGTYNGLLYTKHCSSDCMADAIGGGYGEALAPLLDSIRVFLEAHRGEIVLVTFSHFCEREIAISALADSVLAHLGDRVARITGNPAKIPLPELAGKVLVTFEGYARRDGSVDSCSIADYSGGGVNFRRAYAGTDKTARLVAREALFFQTLGTVHPNDLVRLDWQLTQSSDEAAMTCNDFQNEKAGALVNGALLLTNIIRKHQSILSLSRDGNKLLAARLNDWIARGLVTPGNKPNILYVDVAGAWITDYCLALNRSPLYHP